MRDAAGTVVRRGARVQIEMGEFKHNARSDDNGFLVQSYHTRWVRTSMADRMSDDYDERVRLHRMDDTRDIVIRASICA